MSERDKLNARVEAILSSREPLLPVVREEIREAYTKFTQRGVLVHPFFEFNIRFGPVEFHTSLKSKINLK